MITQKTLKQGFVLSKRDGVKVVTLSYCDINKLFRVESNCDTPSGFGSGFTVHKKKFDYALEFFKDSI